MLQRTAKGLMQVLAGLVAGFVIVTLVSAWMLSRGPISLGLVEGHITNFLRVTFPAVEIEFEDTILKWAGWDRAIDIEVVNLRMATADGKLNLSVPNLAFSVSTKALMQGVAAPSRLELFGPTISVKREINGNFNLAIASALSAGHLETFLRELSAPPREDDPLGYLRSIVVEDADIIIEDAGRGKSWVTPDAQISLVRNGSRLDGETSFLLDLGTSVADVSIVGSYDDKSERIDAGISFGSIVLSELADTTPELAALKNLDLPLHGTVTIASSINGVLEGVGFDVIGDHGSIRLPLPEETKLTVDSLELRGQFDATKNVLEVAGLSLAFADDFEIFWPAPVNHSFPLQSIHAVGSYALDEERLDLEQLDANLSGFDVQLSVLAEQILSAPKLEVAVDIPSMSVADLKSSWPSTVLDDTQRWITESVDVGKLMDVHVDIKTSTADDGEINVDDVQGRFSLAEVTLRYVSEMPAITDASATATFDKERFDFDVTWGQSAGMDLTTGHVALMDISSDVEHAEITGEIAGELDRVLALIEREPLNFASEVGIDPETVSGAAVVDLSFRFPLLNDLEWEDVEVSALARTKDVNIPGGLFGLDVSNAQLHVAVDNDGMNVSGELLLHKFPGRLAWHQDFAADAPVKNEYQLSVQVTDVKDVTDLGIDVRPFSADMIRGTVPLDIHVTERNDGTASLKAVASLEAAEMTGSAINWHKDAGVPGTATLSLELVDKKIAEIPSFLVETDDLIVSGSAAYRKPGGYLSRIVLDKIAFGRTEMAGLLVPAGNGVWDADFRGPSLDMSPFWEDILHGDLLASGESLLRDISMSVQFDRVILSEGRGMQDTTGVLSRADDIWRSIYLTSRIEGGESLEIKLTPSEKNNARILTVWSLDAGSVLRTLDLYDDMVGGELSLTGSFDDSQPSNPLTGNLDILDYRILRAPGLARVLSLLALTGFLDALQGEGLSFDQLVLPFAYQDGILEMENVKANGASLGFTASGRVYSQVDRIDINGTIIPVYVLNSLLGHIPVIGDLITGGEDGGGLIAANYSMVGPLEDPEVSINPLSVLTPGFLRKIFSGERDDDSDGDGNEPGPPEKNRSIEP